MGVLDNTLKCDAGWCDRMQKQKLERRRRMKTDGLGEPCLDVRVVLRIPPLARPVPAFGFILLKLDGQCCV